MFYSPSARGFFHPEIHTDIPSDAVEITEEQHQALLLGESGGFRIEANAQGQPALVAPLPPSPEQLQSSFVAAIQQRLDTFAQARGYDGILSACSYASSSVAKFAAEGRRAVDLRDQTWATANEILGEVQAGTRPMPASLADIEDDLPKLEWAQ